MDKDTAARLEGMLLGSRALLLSVADFVRENAPEGDRQPMVLKIGAAMAELLDLSWAIYERYPGLNPYPEETRQAEEMNKVPR